jgi:hypothetical protein
MDVGEAMEYGVSKEPQRWSRFRRDERSSQPELILRKPRATVTFCPAGCRGALGLIGEPLVLE